MYLKIHGSASAAVGTTRLRYDTAEHLLANAVSGAMIRQCTCLEIEAQGGDTAPCVRTVNDPTARTQLQLRNARSAASRD